MPDVRATSPAGGLRGLIADLLRFASPRRKAAPGDADTRAERPQPPAIAIAGSQPQWLRVLDASALLQVVQADKPIAHIWRVSRLSRPVFERDCLAALRRYAEFVQLLPASESHHHAHAGGLLAHTVETLLAAMTWRNGRLLPEGAPIEEIDAQRDEWTLVVFYAALLHDIGKVLADLRVTWRARNLEAVRWMPLAGSLIELAQGRALAEYLVEFTARVERDYSAHSRTAVLLLQRIASGEALAILARTPKAFEALNQYLSGQDKDSLLAQIVRQADKASVQRSLANGSRARFATARAVPLVDLLMQALKSMLREGGELPLNRSGAAGWVHQGSLWLVAKRTADATRAWINKHEPGEAVPGETKNDRLFDTWQEYGCILPNPATGQAIWYVTVQGQAPAKTEAEGGGEDQDLQQGAYAHNLAMLRFRLDKLYDDPEQYPAPMSGTIMVLEKRTANSPEAEAGDEREAVAAQETPKTEAGADKSPKTASGSGGQDAGHRKKPEKPSKSESLPSLASMIRAPAFNKPKFPLSPPSAPEPVVVGRSPVLEPAPEPAPAPVPAQTSEPVATPVTTPAQPVKTAEQQACAPESPTVQPVEPGKPRQQRIDDESAHLLDESDRATPQVMRREHEQRLLAQVARQTKARKTAPQEPSDLPAISTGTAADPPMPKPVLLEPRKPPKLLKGIEQAQKAEREAVVSPIALAFIGWLQNALMNREITYNETGAAVHFVEHGMALVSPIIFKRYAATQVPEAEIAEHALQVQRELVKARWHVAGPGNTNILRYQVLGRNGATARLAAIVLSEPERFVLPVPPSNPVLKLDNGAGSTGNLQGGHAA